MRASIVATCFLFSGCAESPVSSNGAQAAPQFSSQTTQSLDTVSSIRDGVFSFEQSRRGEMQYLETCKRCHQRDLRGDFIEDAPPLVGEEFLSEWAPWTVGDLFEYVTIEMPPKPKDRLELTPDIYVDILAYILEKNGFPAGQEELPPEFEPLSTIEMGLGE